MDWLLPGAAALCMVPVFRAWSHGGVSLHDAAPLIGTGFFLFGALVSYERSQFSFDPHRAEVRWFRRSLWSRSEGRVSFSRLQSVVLQTAIGSARTCPYLRLALITDCGEIPLTRSYAGGRRREYEALAETIRGRMKLSTQPAELLAESVRAAVLQGRKVDAIKLVRLKKGLSLEEAMTYVERLSSGAS
jgi:hypothetical protein